MPNATPLVTAEELERFPRDDRRYELVEGRVVRMSPVGYPHARTVATFMLLLNSHLRARGGELAVTELGCKLASNPDTVRAPDVAYIGPERRPSRDARGFFAGAPDLAVEVLSPDDRPWDVRARVDDYLAHGVVAVVVVDPGRGTVTVYRRSTPPLFMADDDDVLDLNDVVAGFRCTVRDVFGR